MATGVARHILAIALLWSLAGTCQAARDIPKNNTFAKPDYSIYKSM